jgi:hypothetical protein
MKNVSKFENGLMPIKETYFNNHSECSKREDFEKLAEEFLSLHISCRGGNWETESGYMLAIEEFSSWLNQRYSGTAKKKYE